MLVLMENFPFDDVKHNLLGLLSISEIHEKLFIIKQRIQIEFCLENYRKI